MKPDAQLQADVLAELEWDPAVNAENIGVTVKDGVVTLAGHVATYMEKHAVERAAYRVAGVRGIAVDLDVRFRKEQARDDSEIARAAVGALKFNSLVPADKVQVEVEDGWVNLTGEVDWAYQSAIAEQVVSPLAGVRDLANEITIRPRVQSSNIAEHIGAALKRRAQREAGHIKIEVEGGVVTLRGQVHSLAEREAAVGAAMSTAGVSRVVDKLAVDA
jgi:osmotically-inducible protein OsmY